MQNDFYLLEDSPEAKDMREHIHNLLMSHDETNHELALQLIEGGGMHPDFTAPLVMHTISLWWSGYSKKGISTVKLLKQTLSIEELTYLRTSSRG
jgi:hypothetical protein